jgi:hypothetical protein
MPGITTSVTRISGEPPIWSIVSSAVTASGTDADVDDAGPHHSLPAEGQELAGERGCAVRGLAYRVQAAESGGDIELAAVTGRKILAEKLGIAVDGEQHVIEVVRDATGEAADGFELLCLEDLCLGDLARRDVDDRREDERSVCGVDRCESDVDRELGTVLAPGREVQAGPHWPGDRMGQERAWVRRVEVGHAFGDQEFDRRSDDLGARIAERLLDLRVGVDHVSGRIDGPSGVSTGDRLISTGNSRPSRCHPVGSSPIPIGRGVGWVRYATRCET